MNFKPLFDNILIKPIEVTETSSKIYTGEDKNSLAIGEVITVGFGKPDVTKTATEISKEIIIKPGQKVAYPSYLAKDITIDNNKRVLVRQEEIVGVYE